MTKSRKNRTCKTCKKINIGKTLKNMLKGTFRYKTLFGGWKAKTIKSRSNTRSRSRSTK